MNKISTNNSPSPNKLKLINYKKSLKVSAKKSPLRLVKKSPLRLVKKSPSRVSKKSPSRIAIKKAISEKLSSKNSPAISLIKPKSLKIPIELITVEDARFYYAHNIPIACASFQTYGGLDENDKIPTLENYTQLEYNIILDGSLKTKIRGTCDSFESCQAEYEKGESSKIIQNWLSSSKDGPYYKGVADNNLYYLGIKNEIEGNKWIQICSKPFNVLSSDCMDEVQYWKLKK